MERKSIIATFTWQVDDSTFRYPIGLRTYATGYREAAGSSDLFSIVLDFLDVSQGNTKACTRVRILPLAPTMAERLPGPGERFFVTAGFRVVAVCVAKYYHQSEN